MNYNSWVLNPMVPWLMIVLALWVATTTMLLRRVWSKLQRLEKKIKENT